MTEINYIKVGKNNLSAYLEINSIINFIPRIGKRRFARIYGEIKFIKISWLFIAITFENKIKYERNKENT